MTIVLILASYISYAIFWIRFLTHTLVWFRALPRSEGPSVICPGPGSCALTGLDVLFFGRLLMVNPALWIGEWVFHASFLIVLLRHLRYILDPVPSWVFYLQMPGLIAGYILPLALLYILVIRLLTKREKYAAPANLFLLTLVLCISSIGVLMHALFKPDLVNVKFFVLGILRFSPSTAPDSLLFTLHFVLALALVPFLPTHIFTAPFVMWEARKRDQALRLVMHDE